MPIITPWEHDKPKSKAEIRSIIQMVAFTIERLIKQAAHLPTKKDTISYAYPSSNTRIEDYIRRFVELAELGEPELICLLIILDKYTEGTKQVLNQWNIHRLIAATFVITQKTYSNHAYDMDYYSHLAEVPLPLMEQLEKELSIDLDCHNLVITPEQYSLYKENLISCVRKLEHNDYSSGAKPGTLKTPCASPASQISRSIPVDKTAVETNTDTPSPSPASSNDSQHTFRLNNYYSPRFWMTIPILRSKDKDIGHFCTIS